jgi:N-acetylglucosaminyl-diphospho-decaprenol L-rhamnosyltransferase
VSEAGVDRSGAPPRLTVAIVIVSYQCALLTIQCLRSIESQLAAPGLNIRAIVIDNASGDVDAVAGAIKEHGWSSWAICVAAPRNGGFAFGNNLGMRRALAAGPVSYFYLLNPDTELRAGAIGTLVRFMESNPGVGIAGGSFENRDGSDWPMAFRFPSLTSELLAGVQVGMLSRLFGSSVVPREMTKQTQPTDWICGAAMMIRASVIAATAGLDENYFLYFEETDLCRRALRAGFRTWYVPDSRVMHIMGQSTHVTGSREGSRRLPPYWFESRRRYYAVTFGLRKAMLIDAVAVVSLSLGSVKTAVLRRRAVPFFLRDLLTHSILRKRNRVVLSFKSSLMK